MKNFVFYYSINGGKEMVFNAVNVKNEIEAKADFLEWLAVKHNAVFSGITFGMVVQTKIHEFQTLSFLDFANIASGEKPEFQKVSFQYFIPKE